jgi:outer membrane protein assembly factor BamB
MLFSRTIPANPTLYLEKEYLMKHLVCSLCFLALFSFAAIAQESNWNQFRGPHHNNHSATTGMAKSWGEGGPKLLWQIDTLGIGYSNISFFGDMMFTLGDVGEQCFVFALDRKTGKEIWKQPLGKSGTGTGAGGRQAANNSVGPLGTPACDGETVYTYSQYGDFAAFNMKDGKERWRKDIVNELGGNIMANWGISPSPILDGDKILLPMGGDGGTLGTFDKTGKLLWRTTEIKEAMAYTSAVPVEIGGVRQYMLLTGTNIYGISPTDGKVLWKTEFPGRVAVCSDPVLCGDVVMAGCGYNVGAGFYRVAKEGDSFKASQIHFDASLISHHGGIVAVGDHFYLLSDRKGLTCVEAKTGNIVWENRSVGKGSLTFVDGKLICRSESGDGTIALVEASPAGYKELGKFNQPNRSSKNSWTYPVIVDGKMCIRDQGLLLCYDLK